KIIRSLKNKPTQKAATHNLDRICCSFDEMFGYQPTDGAIWASIRSTYIHRLTRNFLWKSAHNIYHVGAFWDHILNFANFGQCSNCHTLESLEHIMLECDAPGQQQVWKIAETFWKFRYCSWPKLNWGLLL
ncbi:hypothetical protein C8R44DRAFT_534835, partial [Mycena epipterygia]